MDDLATVQSSVDGWIDGTSAAAGMVRRFELELRRRNIRAFMFGGCVRDAVLMGATALPRDVDIVLDVPHLSALEPIWRTAGLELISITGFGGIRVRRGPVIFDLWPLRETWAFQRGYVSGISFANLPRTTDLTTEAIAVEIGGDREVHDAGFVAAIREGLIDLNLEPSPSAARTLCRALRVSSRFGFRFGARLRSLADANALPSQAGG